MPIVNIDLPTSPKESLSILVLSNPQIRELVLAKNVRLFAGRKKVWANLHLAVDQRVFHDVPVKLHVDHKDPDRLTKIAAISAGIQKCKAAGLVFPDATVEFYLHNSNQACLGYLMPTRPVEKFVIILGTGVLHTTKQLVATLIGEQNASRSSQTADEAKATAAVVHELGHCFHQLQNPSQFHCLAEAAVLKRKEDSELTSREYRERHALLRNASKSRMDGFLQGLRSFSRKVSEYAATHPCEFVAECFAGQVMGLAYEQSVLDAYRACGGPALNLQRATTTHRSTQTVSTQSIAMHEETGEGL